MELNTSEITPRSSLWEVLQETGKIIVGQRAPLREVLVSILAGGHILLEGVPGIAKTTMVKTLAKVMGAQYNRIQFTPDLMPSDVIGTNVFNLANQQFEFHPGPIFTDLLLADEINRTPPKTQAALLEAMQERQVTTDGKIHPLSPAFTVVATQNPVEYEGTYPLPEAQLDRFLMKVRIGYPSVLEERELLTRYHNGFDPEDYNGLGVRTVLDLNGLEEERKKISQVKIEDRLFDYLQAIVTQTRESANITLGASPRAAVGLLLCAKASAVLSGRDFLIPDDIKTMAYPVLRHRILLKPESEIEGVTTEDEIRNILNTVEVPR